jgi:hypothetical protein
MRALGLILLLLPIAPALAQGVACPTRQPGDPGLPLYLNLQGLKGVPSGVSGQVAVNVPSAPPPDCAPPAPRPPTDVLHGDPGDVLHGEGPADVLRGAGTPRVEYGPAQR